MCQLHPFWITKTGLGTFQQSEPCCGLWCFLYANKCLFCCTEAHQFSPLPSQTWFERVTTSYTEYEGLFQKNTFARIHIDALNVTVPSAKIGYIIPRNATNVSLRIRKQRDYSPKQLSNGGL